MLAHQELNPRAKELVARLADLARKGPVPALATGSTAVGVTLLHHLGVPLTSLEKGKYKGIVITARRGSKAKDTNRVNLFAKVPDWSISKVKSTAELLACCGYERDGNRKLYCTVRSRQPNSQGLFLEVDRPNGLLLEKQGRTVHGARELVAWRIEDLEKRLVERQPESAWIAAIASKRDGIEHFHFRYLDYTATPRVTELAHLLDLGTVTVDHLISDAGGKIVEKGPLFKIKPQNVGALFPVSYRVDLLRV